MYTDFINKAGFCSVAHDGIWYCRISKACEYVPRNGVIGVITTALIEAPVRWRYLASDASSRRNPPCGGLVVHRWAARAGRDSREAGGEEAPPPLVSASETERGSELPPLPRRCGAWSEWSRSRLSRVRSYVRSVGRPSVALGASVHARGRASHVGIVSVGDYAVATPVSPSVRVGRDTRHTRARTRAQADAYPRGPGAQLSGDRYESASSRQDARVSFRLLSAFRMSKKVRARARARVWSSLVVQKRASPWRLPRPSGIPGPCGRVQLPVVVRIECARVQVRDRISYRRSSPALADQC